MKDVSVKRSFSYEENLKKWYKCIFNDTMLINEDFNIKIQPGQIVQIQTERTINGWPLVFIENRDYDMAIEKYEFDAFFKEFDINVIEERMSAEEFKKIFECTEVDMEHYKRLIYDGFYKTFYDLARERMIENALDNAGHHLSIGYDCDECKESILDYILLHNKFSGEYRMSDWFFDTLKNCREYLDDFDVENVKS